MVEAEALGDRARELVVGERAVLRPAAARAARPSSSARATASSIDPLLDEAEVDDHVREHAAGPTAP